MLSWVKNKFLFLVRKHIYTSLAQSYLIWGSTITGATSLQNINRLESTQNKIFIDLCNTKYNSHTQPLYYSNGLLKASDLIFYSQVLVGYKFRKGTLPTTLNTLFKFFYEEDDRSCRENLFNFHVPPLNSCGSSKFPFSEIVKAWNRLPVHFKFTDKTASFKKEVKNFLLNKYSNFWCEKIRCYACKQSNGGGF